MVILRFIFLSSGPLSAGFLNVAVAALASLKVRRYPLVSVRLADRITNERSSPADDKCATTNVQHRLVLIFFIFFSSLVFSLS